MMRYPGRLIFAAGLLLVALTVAAISQGLVLPCYFVSANDCRRVSAANPLPITGSFSATTTGFPTTQTTGTPISVTTGGVTGTLPSGTVVVASNVGATNAAYCKLGASATTSDQYIAPNGGWFAFTVGAATQLTCITSTSTTTVNMVGGSGLPTGTGGGSGGGSGSGLSVVDEAAFTAGTSPFTPGGGFFQTTATANALTNGQQGMAQLTAQRALFANLRNASGTEIGTAGAPVRTDPTGTTTQPVSGTITANAGTNLNTSALMLDTTGQSLLTAINSAIPAGTNLIGKVGVDQTTPGTTNGVALVGVNGATALAGNGATGTGSPRVTPASDSSAIANWGHVATGAAPPANTVYTGGLGSGATGGLARANIICDLHAFYTGSDNGSKTLVAGVSGRKTYICGWLLTTGTTATTLTLFKGTDADCATSGAAIGPPYALLANDKVGVSSAFWNGFVTATNADYVCINAGAGNAHTAEIWYAIL